MSPEQARGTAVDKRSDLWAFGVVLYEMLAGTRLFDGPTVSDTLALVLTKEPDWTRLPADTPASIRRLLRRCLERDRRRRLPDAADIRIEIDDAQSATPAVVAPVRTARPLTWMVATVALSVVVVAMGAFLASRFRVAGAPPQIVRFEVALPDDLTLTPPNRALASFAISPDGRAIAFVGVAGLRTQLWLRSIDEIDVRPIAGTEGATGLTWSPDSLSLAFVVGRQIKIARLGGAVRLLAEVPPDLGATGVGAWGQSGTILLGSAAPAGGVGLISVDVASGKISVVTRCANECEGHVQPAFLPDGRRFLYSALGTPSGLFLGSLDTAEARKISPDYGNVGLSSSHLFALSSSGPPLLAYPFDAAGDATLGEPVVVTDQVAWNPQNRRGTFSVARNGTLVTSNAATSAPSVQLTWVSREGKPMRTVAEAGVLSTMRLSPDGRRVVYGRRDTSAAVQNLNVTDLESGATVRLTASKMDSDGAWSPDGSRIAFASVRADGKRIYVMPSAGGSEELLPIGNDAKGLSIDDWSPDGRTVLYHMDATRELWAQPLQGGSKPILIVKPAAGRVDQAAFSPDSRWIAYASEEKGRSEIYVAPFPPTGERWPVSVSGGMQPAWRGDGRELFFLAPDGNMMAADVRPAAARPEFGAPHILFKTDLTPIFQTEQYDVSADGQRFLIMMPQGNKASRPRETMTVWMNWMPGKTQ
jgi:Tol biopolymer transport system component